MGDSRMALSKLKASSRNPLPYAVIAVLLLALTYMLSDATQDKSRLDDLFLVLLSLGIFILILLTALLFRSLLRLYRDFKKEKPGSRLTLRLVTLFVVLILVSTSIVYSFSVHFLHRGINSWFDVEIEQALDDALELSRTAVGIRIRTLLRQTRLMSDSLRGLPDSELSLNLLELSTTSGAEELSIWTTSGQLITSSIQNPGIIVPNKPSEAIFRQLEQEEDYISLDPGEGDRLIFRAAVKLPARVFEEKTRVLHAIYPVSKQLNELSAMVQNAYMDYRELNYLRKPLIQIFTLTLSLIVLLTVLASIWFAIWISQRIVQPLQELADGTQSVAAGNYNTQLTLANQDEIGFLVQSFNQMTQRLKQARDATQTSHRLLEQQTNYLSTVLGSLSSGVITFDQQTVLKTANPISSTILNTDLQLQLNKPLQDICLALPPLEDFLVQIAQQLEQKNSWQHQIDIKSDRHRQTLICQGTPLPNNAGWVVVFDDITTLIQAQRNAAWGEVARRLAHEIKNPLTPIQLSAERLQHKYQPLLPEEHTGLLNKLTNTIIQQVDAMKEMVNDFSNYARSSQLQLGKHSLTTLIKEVCALYQSNPEHSISFSSKGNDVVVELDSNRIRQVLHNLIKNAIEAGEDAQRAIKIEINYTIISRDDSSYVELEIRDYGPGIPDEMINTLFEPYATSKTKGTGLGLAIVKKIIDEHQGDVWVDDYAPDGARIVIQLPLERPNT
jgi:nitrogen fixation/metabolism regulation signal transduction histidine kinase